MWITTTQPNLSHTALYTLISHSMIFQMSCPLLIDQRPQVGHRGISEKCQFRKSGPRSWYRVVGRYAATFFFVTTVMTQRAGRLDATSLTERTNPVTTEPSIVNVALWFRYWANRQRRATF